MNDRIWIWRMLSYTAIIGAVHIFSVIVYADDLSDDVRYYDTNAEYEDLSGDLSEIDEIMVGHYLSVADFFFDNEQYSDAITVYATAISKNKNAAAAWYGLARCYALTSEHDKCYTALNKAVHLNPIYKAKASADDAFDGIRDNEAFSDMMVNTLDE